MYIFNSVISCGEVWEGLDANYANSCRFPTKQAALNHLVERVDIDTSRIVVFGRSLGGAVGTALVRNNPDKVISSVHPYRLGTTLLLYILPSLPHELFTLAGENLYLIQYHFVHKLLLSEFRSTDVSKRQFCFSN